MSRKGGKKKKRGLLSEGFSSHRGEKKPRRLDLPSLQLGGKKKRGGGTSIQLLDKGGGKRKTKLRIINIREGKEGEERDTYRLKNHILEEGDKVGEGFFGFSGKRKGN